MSKRTETDETVTSPDLHDKKDPQTTGIEEQNSGDKPQENPGTGLVGARKNRIQEGREADAEEGVEIPSSPRLTPGGQRIRELVGRVRSAANTTDIEVLNGEPVVEQRHRNQAMALRKHVVELLNEGYGEITGDANAITIRVSLQSDADYGDDRDDAQKFDAKNAVVRDDSTGDTRAHHTQEAVDKAEKEKEERDKS